VVFAADADHIYSAVDHKPKRTLNLKRLRNIRSHPRVALLVDHYEDDWSELWWVRVDGTARIEESGPERERALRLLEEKYAQYRPKGPRGPVIIITIDRISGWSAGRD
jgi:PPOX class probable F420-dependent enzyme